MRFCDLAAADRTATARTETREAVTADIETGVTIANCQIGRGDAVGPVTRNAWGAARCGRVRRGRLDDKRLGIGFFVQRRFVKKD